MNQIKWKSLEEATPKQKDWLLSRMRYFIALYESGKKEPSEICYELFRGFTMCGILPEKNFEDTLEGATNLINN